MLSHSMPRFTSVADGQNHDLLSVVMVEGDISSVSEFNHPLAEFRRHFFDWAADFRMLGERSYALSDCFNGALGGVATLWS